MITKTADAKFSRLIRERDPICARCMRNPSTDCSHFYERGNSSTRFNPENCDGACRLCHNFWHANRAEYKRFKLEQLGEKRYMALQRLAATTMQRSIAIENFKKLIS